MREKTLRAAGAVAAATLIAAATASLAAQSSATTTEFVGNAVVNPTAQSDTTGWNAYSASGPVAVTRVTGISGGPTSTTGIDVSRSANTGEWSMAVAALSGPSFFQVGHTYRMRVWARDVSASGRKIELLLANNNYGHRPSEASGYVRSRDTSWHLVTKTFVATANASDDTELYLGLPTYTAVHFQFADASVSELVTRAQETAAPDGDAAPTSPAAPTTSAAAPVTPVAPPAAAAPSTPVPPVLAPAPAPEPAPAPAPAPVSSVSGQSMPVGDLPGWHQVFADDFTTPVPLGQFPGTAYGRTWTGYDGFHDTSGIGTYSESKVLSVQNGALDMYLHSENGTPYVAAPVPAVNGNAWAGQTYGRYEVRFRADPVPGFATAWLLWPTSNNWNEGEIDFPEGTLDSTINAFNHQLGNPSNNAFYASAGVTYSGWHTAVTEWTPAGVTYYIDGRSIGTSSVSPSTPMRWTLQTETAYGARPPADASGHIQIDWVSVYSRS